jgi:homoserine trans-succinylase
MLVLSWPIELTNESFQDTHLYRGVDKSLVRPTSRCILYDGENISFHASLVIYINSTNIPSIMIINRMYEIQNFCRCRLFPPGRAKDLSAPL